MLTWNAYKAEIECWKNSDPNYCAIGHVNLNADNAYYWRDEAGKLDCGVIDWGGFGENCLGHKMWWCFNCADFEQVQHHLDEYIDIFVTTFQQSGGPQIRKEVMRMQVFLTAIANIMFMVKAVPNCYTMCPEKEFATITDRLDPRVSSDVHGKSTLRTTLQVLNNGVRLLEEMQADSVLDAWIRDVFVGTFGCEPKTEAMIHDT